VGFNFYLTRYTSWLSDVRQSVMSDPPARPVQPTHARDVKVLVVEDHPTNRRVVQMMLEPFGFLMTFAENGLEGVRAWERDPFDVVLMDLQMPVMDGLTAIREIRGREKKLGRPRTAIAVVSANVGPEAETAAFAAGSDLHIPKPLSLDGLISGIAQALEHARR